MAIKITDPKIRVTMINDKVRMYLLPPHASRGPSPERLGPDSGVSYQYGVFSVTIKDPKYFTIS